MPTTAIDRLYTEHRDLEAHLLEHGQISFVSNVDANFRKALLLAAASYFEVRIRDCILDFVKERAARDELVTAFLKNKAIERQYHTYFDWEKTNANKFFSLFGPGFKERMAAAVAGNEQLKQAIAAFLEVGALRNNLVHQDFASFPLDKTVDDIYRLYKAALEFVDVLPTKLRDGPAASAEAT
jgi:hypothetical protein